jgi:integrase
VIPERFRAAVLLGALAGLRLAESCGLRISDVDFMRGIVFPRVQYPAEELKTEISRTPVPVGQSLASLLIAHGADVKTVQARLRHGSAKTTLDTYGHLWPEQDESTKAVIDTVVDSKFRVPADSVRTEGGAP